MHLDSFPINMLDCMQRNADSTIPAHHGSLVALHQPPSFIDLSGAWKCSAARLTTVIPGTLHLGSGGFCPWPGGSSSGSDNLSASSNDSEAGYVLLSKVTCKEAVCGNWQIAEPEQRLRSRFLFEIFLEAFFLSLIGPSSVCVCHTGPHLSSLGVAFISGVATLATSRSLPPRRRTKCFQNSG